MPITSATLAARLDELSLREAHRLRDKLRRADRERDPQRRAAALADLAARIDADAARVAARRAAVPPITLPEALPVSQRADEIGKAIAAHRVVVVAGETGSGKTTQLPKICLGLGRGVRGLIGHTQPRRIAARSVADRIAEELGTRLGGIVGYQVRFSETVGGDTMVKLMTDGILLAEIQRDRSLRRYDTLIIDEAHERSLNIDFLLGYLTRLLPRRPDLKLVITSATIDPQRFADHFAAAIGEPVPVIEVSGRTYPVEVRYRPLVDDTPDGDAEPRDQVTGIRDAVTELWTEGSGDILVFCSGEREIRDAADALHRMNLPATEVLPLFARLSIAEQHRVFAPHGGRRIVLATNVAETSLTVPGIRYVVDPGTARISRYSHRLKVQRLPIEPVSRASADQRKGRCGRVAAGVAIRLYAEEDFAARPAFTDPEILRTNLASVILRMAALGLGEVADFPFVEPPDRRQITDGVRLLEELGALDPAAADPATRLTPLGRKLAALPVDPRLGRMVLEAERLGCVDEVMVITAALSIQDPRERPTDHQQAADTKHARFRDKESDFAGLLNLWRYVQEQQRELSSSAFRRMCRTDFLNYLRVREWQDLYQQLRQVGREIGVHRNTTPADERAVHTALLAGLLSHLGLYDQEKREYVGARGARFALFPGSALFKKNPRWVMAAELVETSRLWGRMAARIEPEWVEPLAGHLVKRQYSEPHWSSTQAAALAYEKVTLYGLPIVAKRRVQLSRIDAPLARELFLRHALVEGDWPSRHAFVAHNAALRAEVEELEHRARRRDIVVDDDALYAFYDARVPADVTSGRHFDAWWKKERHDRPELLNLTREILTNPDRGGVSERDYPPTWAYGEHALPLAYQFEPGAAADGVTVAVPLALLPELDPKPFTWQVPGLRRDLIAALLRSLPKPTRRHFVPVPDYAAALAAELAPGADALLPALERALRGYTGVVVARHEWDPAKVPEHLRMTFRVVDGDGAALAEGKDLPALVEKLRPTVRETLAATDELTRTGATAWDFGELPRTVPRRAGGISLTGYPTLVDEGTSVGVTVVESPAAQQQRMWAGTRRLLLLTAPPPYRSVQGRLSNAEKLGLSRNPHGGVPALLDDCARAAVDGLLAAHGGPAWDAAGFAALRERVRAELPDRLYDVVRAVGGILGRAYGIEKRLAGTANPLLIPAFTDIRAQVHGLVYRGFVVITGAARLGDLDRYLHAIELRLDRVPANPHRDRELMAQVHEAQREYKQLYDDLRGGGARAGALAGIRWMLEELRVSLFTPALGTAYPISLVRIQRAIDDLADAGR
ncbi:ATP-dependent RNA helicase HrpA [Pilimelia anulata]|uniref:RNA helicase n=1 Tax=Pilimelia anulata TaxID=53371 RepID=A0A8J3F8N9_9ACTN|nr:ATP-dependent RNA helicase HrpA [Pilimelia anulata]GGJ80044.1 ATP-dependent RNA helicase HrpA [Pilimelia anulata]